MDTLPQDHLPTPEPDELALSGESAISEELALSRRKFLRNAALTGGGLVAAAGLAACAPATTGAGWTFGPTLAGGSAAPAPSAAPSAAASAGASMSMAPSPAASASAATGPIPTGWTTHDIAARNVVRRYIGNLAPALKDIYPAPIFTKLAGILGAEDNYPELSAKPSFAQVQQLFLNDATKPLTPRLQGDVKVFKLTVDEITQQIDEVLPPVAGLGFNGPAVRL